MSTTIDNINSRSKDELSADLLSRNITPDGTLEEMRIQARRHNKNIKISEAIEHHERSVNPDNDSEFGSNYIKYTKVIYNESNSSSSSSTSTINNWNIKFDGNSCVRDFILEIEEKCRIRNVRHDDLVRCFPDILDGLALLWFRSIYTPDLTWNELSILLIKQFETNNRQIELKSQLFSMKQPAGMSVFEFTLRMQKHNNMLDSKLPLSELLQLCMRALLPIYINLLASRDFNSFSELTEATNKLESYSTSKLLENNSSSFSNDNPLKDDKKNYFTNSRGSNNNNFNSNRNSSYRDTYNNRSTDYNYKQNNNIVYNNNKQYSGNSANNNNTRFFYNNQSKKNTSNDYREKEMCHPEPNSTKNNIYCSFCKLKGHLLSDCRKRRQNNPNPRVASVKHGDSKN